MSRALCKASCALTVIFSNRIMFLVLRSQNFRLKRLSLLKSCARYKFDERVVKKGPANFAGPSYVSFALLRGSRFYFTPAVATAAAGAAVEVPTVTLICFGLASSRFGTV